MPSPEDFLKGFGLEKGLEISGKIISKITIKHLVISQYYEYHFPIVIEFKDLDADITKEQFFKNFKKYINKYNNVIVNSHYGNPYECKLTKLVIKTTADNRTIIGMLGVGIRV